METTTDYQKQGVDFLSKYGITMKVKFLKNDYHFSDDKETRDIFGVTFLRGSHRFYIRFGQSISESTYTGKNKPTAYDVLACITKSDPEDFNWFCSEYGYDTDSRTAYKTWQALKKEWQKVSSFFTPEEIEELQEIY